jgi:hypothetical protein
LFFWFKKKEIILDCFTDCPGTYEFAKPDFAYKFFPNWFLNLKKTVAHKGNDIPTIRECHSFKRYYTSNTIVIPMPYMATIEIGTTKNPYYEWQSHQKEKFLFKHFVGQTNGFVEDDHFFTKISPPWKFRTNKFVEFLWSDPVWNRPNPLDYSILPATIDFKYQFDIQVNLLFKYKEAPQNISFSTGQALVMLAPLFDKAIKIKHHLVDQKITQGLTTVGASATKKSYLQKKQVIKAAEKRDAMKKCPFHLR